MTHAVISFQESGGVYADGIVGPRTKGMLEQALREWILEQHSPGVESIESLPERLPFVRVPASKYRDGYH